MKKFLGVIMVCLLTINITAQIEKVFEGYGKLPWGSSIENVKNEYANLYEKTSVEDQKNNERLFLQDNKTTTRVFRFYNEKLYWTRIVYDNPNSTTIQAVVERLFEQYEGYITVINDGEYEKNNTRTTWNKWEITPTFTVSYEFNEYYNVYGKKTDESLFVTCSNPKIRGEIEKIETERKKEELEF